MNNNKVSLTKTVLFTVCSILVLDSFVAPTIIGVSSITIWIISAIFFFLPYGLMSAELGSTYPDDGGIVSWVQRAFGEFWGVMEGWMYWINVAFRSSYRRQSPLPCAGSSSISVSKVSISR